MSIVDSLIDIINRQINKKFDKLPKRITCEAISEQDNFGYAKVKIADTTTVNLCNKSGEYVSSGDSVVIEYISNISLGCIIRRNGLYKRNGEMDLTQSALDQLEADGKLTEGMTYYVKG